IPKRPSAPKFYPTPTNVTYEKGSLAILSCSVENLGTKTVIWRKQPYNVPITVGLAQFVEINRFKLNHVAHRDEWNLLIKNVQMFDAGTYECQISSMEKLLRRNITLHVIEISITGTRFVEFGGRIFLSCNASGTVAPPDVLDWFKNGNKVTTKLRKDVKIDKKISYSTNTIVSTLVIFNAYMGDTGTYICRSSSLQATDFKVDVLN
ncbi:LRIG1-like protein, partial [Mya arenaria]